MSRAVRRPERKTVRVVNSVREVLLSKQIQNEPVVVAVSGGADSMALLTALAALAGPLELQLTVAHFNHRLRPESDDDAKWLEEYCRRKGVDYVSGVSESTPPKTHVEAWARISRYAFLGSVARRVNARWIAVAHTANDQAETVLHHVLRGTGLRGAAGIPVTRRLRTGARLIRPCLALIRQDLLGCLQEQDVSFREDPSNDDPRFTRNRLRHRLLPMIEEHFNPRASQALFRLAEQSQAVALLIRRQATKLLKPAILDQSESLVRLRTEVFARKSSVVVQEAAVVLWTRLHWPRVAMASTHWKRVGQLLRGKGPMRIELPGGVTGVRRGGLVLLERSSGSTSGD